MFQELDPMVQVAVYPIAEIAGAADADAALEDTKRMEAAHRLNAAAQQATELVLDATPNKRVAGMIEKATKYLGPDATAEQLQYVDNRIQGFARDASEFLMRGDYHGLNSAITSFWNGIQDANKIGPPKQRLMPHGDGAFLSWSSEAQLGLRTILLKGLCGVLVGDRCISADADGATLASGKRVSRAQALEAYIPPAAGKMIMVGSLPAVMNTVLSMNRGAK
jgi:hypothetical protein